MSESSITKKALAASIKQLMETIPLAKISIQKIVDNCGLNRQTFYYHFKDKYELVNWIYYTEAVECIAQYNNCDRWSDGIYKVLLHLQKNKLFYVNALNTPGQNTLDEYFFEITHQLIMQVITSLSVNLNVAHTDRIFIADFYTHAFVGIAIQWVKSGMREPPEIMVERLRGIVQGSMLQAVSRCSNAKSLTNRYITA